MSSLGGLAWYTYYIINNQKEPTGEHIDFAVEDTSAITKIRITDPSSRSIELIRKKKIWTDGKGSCITQGMVNNILDVAINIEFKGYLPKPSHKKYKQLKETKSNGFQYPKKRKR